VSPEPFPGDGRTVRDGQSGLTNRQAGARAEDRSGKAYLRAQRPRGARGTRAGK